MAACCGYWQIARTVQKQPRKPEVLAAELEARALFTAKLLLASKQRTAAAEIGSAEQLATSSAEQPTKKARCSDGGFAKAPRQLEDMRGQDTSNKSNSASSASEPTVTLTALSNLLAGVTPSERKAKVLEHAAKVLAWKKDRTHANRDTMAACCGYWQIARKVQKSMRKPEVLAAKLEARALSTAKVLLASKQCTADAEIGSAEQPASTSA